MCCCSGPCSSAHSINCAALKSDWAVVSASLLRSRASTVTCSRASWRGRERWCPLIQLHRRCTCKLLRHKLHRQLQQPQQLPKPCLGSTERSTALMHAPAGVLPFFFLWGMGKQKPMVATAAVAFAQFAAVAVCRAAVCSCELAVALPSSSSSRLMCLVLYWRGCSGCMKMTSCKHSL